MKFATLFLSGCIVLSACVSTTTPISGGSSAQSSVSNTRYIRVPGSKTILRESPSNSAPRIETLRHGETVTLLEQRGSWVKVREHTFGEVGWVGASFVVASREELNPSFDSNPYAGEAMVAGAAIGTALIAGALGGVFGASRSGGGGLSSETRAPSSSSEVASQTGDSSRGVKRDGDGWVRINGRTIGRVWSSYGYNISCSNGYNPDYGSNSVFGSSFKADVRNMDEAVGVLLAACKR